jgi:hypothetical protein
LWNWFVKRTHSVTEKIVVAMNTLRGPVSGTSAPQIAGTTEMKQLFPFVSMKS